MILPNDYCVQTLQYTYSLQFVWGKGFTFLRLENIR